MPVALVGDVPGEVGSLVACCRGRALVLWRGPGDHVSVMVHKDDLARLRAVRAGEYTCVLL